MEKSGITVWDTEKVISNRQFGISYEGEKLLDEALNEYGLAGENYIRYEVNVQDRLEATLDIYWVGYACGDSCTKPFASVPLKEALTGKTLMTVL